MNTVYLSLGANLGEKEKNFLRAIQLINAQIGTIVDLSGLYETEPWGFESDDKFLNMVVAILSDYSANEVLEQCMKIEKEIGRVRVENAKGYSSRVIDVDILFYNNDIIAESTLIIPHEHILSRRFILEPMCDIAPDFIHPVAGKTIAELLASCSDKTEVAQLGTLQQ